MKELQESSKELARELEEDLAEDGSLGTDTIARQREKLAAAAAKIGGKLGQAIQATDQLNGEIASLAKELQEMNGNISSLLDWESLEKEKDYQRRREFLKQFSDTNRRMLALYQEYPAKLTAKLDAMSYSGPERQSFESNTVKAFNEISRFVTSVRNDDLLFASTFQSLLDAFEKDQGNWRVEEGIVTFDNEELSAKFNKANETFQELGARQNETQKKLVERMKANVDK